MTPPVFTVPAGRVGVGTAINITGPSGVVYITTDGSDPRLPGGTINPQARNLAQGPVLVTEPLLIRARVFAASDWSALIEAFYLPDGIPAATSTSLLLTEIQYHSLEDAAPEFIELLNTSAASVDLSGVILTNAVDYIFPAGTVLSYNERVIVTKDPVHFEAWYRATNSPYYRGGIRLLGPWLGSLSNAGETLTVLAADGAPVLSCTYGTDFPWPVRADGLGSTLELLETPAIPASATARAAWLDDARHWRASEKIHGSPGAPAGTTPPGVVINEILASPGPQETDAIELANSLSSPFPIGGWYLSDRLKTPRKYRFPTNTVLAAGAWHALREVDFNNPGNPACLIPFALDGDGDGLGLIEADAAGNLIRFVDEVDFGATPREKSVGRSPDGVGRWVLLQRASLGQANSAPEPGYDAWRVTAFGVGTAADDTLRGADPDGDRLSNFAEYAFVLRPFEADVPPLVPLGILADGGLGLAYTIRTDAPDVTYTLEVSDNLLEWERSETTVEILTRTVRDNGGSYITARLLPLKIGDDSRRFVRFTIR